MNSQPIVSVLIRTKDRKALLMEAVDSALAQTYTPIEIVIVNDGGEDYSADLSSRHNAQIRWVNNTGDHGRSNAANLALDTAGGEYCLFLDDDDTIDPEHIGNLVSHLTSSDYRLAYSAVRTMTDGVTEESPSFAFPFDPVRLMLENTIPIHAVLFEKSLVEEGCRFDPAFGRFEDWDFWLQAARDNDFLFVNKCTATYRIDSNSGFGAKQVDDTEMNTYRLALYRKWLPRWLQDYPNGQLLALLNRGREYPRISMLEQTISQLKEDIGSKTQFIAQLNARVDDRDRKVRSQQKIIAATEKELHEAERDLLESENELRGQQKINQALKDELQVIYNSRSWKLTRPLRLVTKLRYFLRNEGFRGLMARMRIKLEARLKRVKKIKAQSPVSDHYEPLSFPEFDSPEISIVIPVYNKYQYTFHCLQSILRHQGDERFEVIVMDDCSSDQTQKMLAGISGITVIHNEENQGFINSCNIGANAARGKYLVILNNDTEVRENWLGAMVQTFADFPEAGLVGARLVFADGTLQEAGGIVWRDGSAWNYGRGNDPNKPEYAYARRVDYCSGACLMIPREEFLGYGGFDTHYVPAYYEDTDLAFKVRENGKQVIYQPNATLIHFEGVTSGTDTGSGIKKYQQINSEKFFERWQQVLQSHRPNARLPHMEKERHIDKRILIIDARVLMPDHDSGSLRMYNILRILQSMGYKVSFLPANLQFHEKYTPQMQAVGIECQYLPYVHGVKNFLEDYGQQFDAVILSRADYAEKYIDNVRQHCPNARVLFDTVDLHFLREQREADLTGDKLLAESAQARKSQELAIARKADTTLVVSPVELELFREEAPDVSVSLLSNIHVTYPTANDFSARKDMLFIGNFEHPPNTDAMEFFLDEVMPLVHRENPAINLLVVGGHVPSHLKARACDHVQFIGFVADIKPLFDNIRLTVAPLRYGAGVKGKINSSMSYGVPGVVSTMAAEGMNLEHGKDILIADEPASFAREILRLYEDEALWKRMSEAGKRNIEEHFSFATAESQLKSVLLKSGLAR